MMIYVLCLSIHWPCSEISSFISFDTEFFIKREVPEYDFPNTDKKMISHSKVNKLLLYH